MICIFKLILLNEWMNEWVSGEKEPCSWFPHPSSQNLLLKFQDLMIPWFVIMFLQIERYISYFCQGSYFASYLCCVAVHACSMHTCKYLEMLCCFVEFWIQTYVHLLLNSCFHHWSALMFFSTMLEICFNTWFTCTRSVLLLLTWLDLCSVSVLHTSFIIQT